MCGIYILYLYYKHPIWNFKNYFTLFIYREIDEIDNKKKVYIQSFIFLYYIIYSYLKNVYYINVSGDGDGLYYIKTFKIWELVWVYLYKYIK